MGWFYQAYRRACALSRGNRALNRRTATPVIAPLEARTVLSSFVPAETLPVVPPTPSGHQPMLVAVGSYVSGGVTRPFIAASYVDKVAGDGGGVSVFLGGANGTFNDPIDIALSADLGPKPSPEGIVVGHFTSSGFDDIAVADNNDRVFVIRGNGDGTFGNAVALNSLQVPAGTYPTYLATSTINGSSYLFVSGYSSNKILIFKLDSAGTLRRQKSLSGVPGADQILLAKLNQDGALDLAVANKKANFVTIFRGNGDGTFKFASRVALKNQLTGKLQSVGLTVGDFNGDNAPDLAVADYGPNNQSLGTINILENTSSRSGRISFKNVRNINFPRQPLVNVVSVNLGDAFPGLAVTNNLAGEVDLLHNRGSFRFVKGARVILGDKSNPVGMIAANLPGLNNSMNLDLIVANSDAQTLSILQPS